MGEQRKTTVDDLNAFDSGHRVTFRRPASTPGRPIIVGKLLSVRESSYMRGNMPRLGYMIRVEYAGTKYASSKNIDEFGPLPSSFPIEVGPKWREKEIHWEEVLASEQEETPA